MHLAEVPEDAAPPEITAIYARIRHLTGAPMTALIWRHLATIPGALPEIWQAMGPVYESGAIQEAAWTGARESVTMPPASLSRDRLSAIGLDEQQQDAFVRVLDAYNRANPVNFVAVRAMMRRIATTAPGHTAPAGLPWSPPAPIGALPPMVPVAAIPPTIRRMIDDMASDPRLDRSRLVPSLYRHIVAFDPLVPAIHEALMPRFRSGEIPAGVRATASALDAKAQAIAAMLPPLPRLAAMGDVTATFERFSLVIPEMVVLGLILRRALDATA